MTFAEVAAEYGLSLIFQYGSTVTGRAHAKSDIDVGVVFAAHTGKSLLRLEALRLAVREALGTDKALDVTDVNIADAGYLSHFLDPKIGMARVLFGDPRLLQEFRAYCFRRCNAYRRFFAMERRWVHERLP